MKTIHTLPALPPDWRWRRSCDGCWEHCDPETAGALTDLAAIFANITITFGTPPAGSTVWDPQSLDWARYQPETP